MLQQKRKNGSSGSIDWMEVARAVNYYYTTVQCRDRWLDIQKYKTGGKCQPWDFKEDSALRSVVRRLSRNNNKNAIDWIDVAKTLNLERIGKQCKARWAMLTSVKDGWNDAQDALLISAVLQQQSGGLKLVDWKAVSKFLCYKHTPKQCRERLEAIERTTRNGRNVSVMDAWISAASKDNNKT